PGEDGAAEGEVAVPGLDLPGAGAELAAAKVERADRVDERGPLSRLAGQEVGRLGHEPGDRKVDGPGARGGQGVVVVTTVPDPLQGESLVVIGGVHLPQRAVAPLADVAVKGE